MKRRSNGDPIETLFGVRYGLRTSVAWSLGFLAGLGSKECLTVSDPMCGFGTILIECSKVWFILIF